MMATNPDQPADETYVLPRTRKSDPFIEQDSIMSIERAAAALNTHNDCGPLITQSQWRLDAGILWSDVPTLQGLSRTGPPAQQARYAKWAKVLVHLCHLIRTEPVNPKLQHYKIKIIYTDAR